jgi:cysteine synthase B
MATKAVTDTDTLNRVGNTPLVQLDSLTNEKVTYFAKLEGHNPFGSVKDRAIW